MDGERVIEAATILWSAWTEGRTIAALPERCRPRDLDDGYAVQEAMGRFAGPAAGWKIAATSAEGQRHIGVTAPLAGRLYGRFLAEDGASFAAGPMLMRVAEPEFAFRLGRNLAPRAAPYTTAEVLDAVAALHLAIEVPDSRFTDFERAGAPQLVADDACAGFFVLGPEIEGWRTLDLPSQAVAIRSDDGHVHEGRGANALGDPRLALAWLVNDRAGRGFPVEAGEIVTTGTCAKPLPIEPGHVVSADFGALGTVSARFT